MAALLTRSCSAQGYSAPPPTVRLALNCQADVPEDDTLYLTLNTQGITALSGQDTTPSPSLSLDLSPPERWEVAQAAPEPRPS
jgi:hypothetical protein